VTGAAGLEERLRAFLRADLRVGGTIAADTPLVSSGRIDSVGLVRLAAQVEKATGLRIPDRDVTVAHFDTLARIGAYVERRARA
jgi:acyl carrier protein